MNLSIRKESLSKLIFTIVVFLYVFQPALIPLKMVQVLSVVFLLIIILRTSSRNGMVIKGYGVSIIKSFLPFFLYTTLLFVFKFIFDNAHSDAYIASYVNMILIFTYLFIGVAGTMAIYKSHQFNYPDFEDILISVGIIQLVCVVLAYVSPSVRAIFNGFTIKNSSEPLYVNALLYDARSYGLGENLFDGFGYVTAIIIVVIFNIGISKKDRKLTIISLAMLIMPLLNSRTGLILALIGILISVFMNTDNKGLLKFVRYLIIFIIAVLVGIYGFQYLPESTQSWFDRGFRETMALLSKGEVTGVYKELLVNDVFFPNDIVWGAGASPEMLGMGNADNGYTQFIWRYGLIGTILFFVPYIKSLRLMKKVSHNNIARCMSSVLIVFFFVYLIKMYAFNNSASNYLVFTLIFFEIEKTAYFALGEQNHEQ